MTFKEFEELIKIEYIEGSECFGHHPMNLVVFKEDGKQEFNALLNLSINDIIARVQRYFKEENVKNMYLSLDLPRNELILDDFVLLLNFNKEGMIDNCIQEYNPINGEKGTRTENAENAMVYTIIKHLTS